VLRVRKISRFIIPVLLVVVFCFVSNTTLNQHYHKLSCGLVVKHAHPYEKGNIGNPFQEHQHFTYEFYLLEQIYNIVFWIYVFVFLIASCLFTGKIIIFPLFINHKKRDLYFLKHYRAPPCTSY
jgi:hypothetical protein